MIGAVVRENPVRPRVRSADHAQPPRLVQRMQQLREVSGDCRDQRHSERDALAVGEDLPLGVRRYAVDLGKRQSRSWIVSDEPWSLIELLITCLHSVVTAALDPSNEPEY